MESQNFNNVEIFLIEILKQIQEKKTKGFSGLGIIFYTSISSLPHVSLGGLKVAKPKLPISDLNSIYDVLIEISDIQNSWHDGFHLINIDTFELTHISQYISPPINESFPGNSYDRPTGARQMTALLASTLKFIEYVCILNGKNEIIIYRYGKKLGQK